MAYRQCVSCDDWVETGDMESEYVCLECGSKSEEKERFEIFLFDLKEGCLEALLEFLNVSEGELVLTDYYNEPFAVVEMCDED